MTTMTTAQTSMVAADETSTVAASQSPDPTECEEVSGEKDNTEEESELTASREKEQTMTALGPVIISAALDEGTETVAIDNYINDGAPTLVTSPNALSDGAYSYDASLNADNVEAPPSTSQRGIKVLFLSSDTGGGHRASAESLGRQFELLFPGSTYDLLDVVGEDFGPPYNSLVSVYKHLSAHPSQWKLLYTISNSRGFEMIADAHFKLMFERAIRKRIKKYNPDVVVSVHPMMTNVPVLSCKRISNETGRHLPMFTVVTDLGSAHCLWFANGVEKMFVGSEQVKQLAKARGKVPEEKLVLLGLPIRHDFAVQAENMGDRFSPEGKNYQIQIRAELQLPFTHRKTLLIMGGGEGVGSLSHIVDALYVELVSQGIDALVLVVCGRNEKLRTSLENRDWGHVFARWQSAKNGGGYSRGLMSFGDSCGTSMASPGCIESVTVTGSIRRMLSTGSIAVGNMMSAPQPIAAKPETPYGATRNLSDEKKAEETVFDPSETDESVPADEREAAVKQLQAEIVPSGSIVKDSANTKAAGDVEVLGLGFVTQMAEYMVAADILVSKAGPGTISEAAALSLPIMLTSFLPGQEEGNIDYVIDGGFGAYVNDSDPIGIAEEICMWLSDDARREKLSTAAKTKGAPYAARDIVQQIGDSTLKWREVNDEHEAAKHPPS